MFYNFQTRYTDLHKSMYQLLELPKLTSPQIILLNSQLLNELQLSNTSEISVDDLLGFTSNTTPFAQAYAGHQFGHFTMLGDGRAMILGEHIFKDKDNQLQRFDIQLKGSGPTQYSRGNDGKATAKSMLREYLFSYAMKQLGIDTSQSLAILRTGEKVQRFNTEKGAILIRVMKSHIRFGTFEFASKYLEQEDFKEFTKYVILGHYPHLLLENQELDSNVYLNFFKAVMQKCITMVVNWYRAGFIHGVMNTDNMSIVGETFDYGPCSFMNQYKKDTVFSKIDKFGRYSFENQKPILQWNLSVFAQSLVYLFEKDEEGVEEFVSDLNRLIEEFDIVFDKQFYEMMMGKLGIDTKQYSIEDVKSLIDEMLDFLEETCTDYTNFFIELMYPNSFEDEIFSSEKFSNLKTELQKIGLNVEIMKHYNPQRILRNYLVEEALEEYESTEKLDKIQELLDVVSSPYEEDERFKKYQLPPSKEFEKRYTTHCNT